MTKKGLASFIEEGVRRRAGIKKKLSCHDFRHTAVTEKARQGWTEAEMRAYFGWKRDSPMPSRYTHLSGRDMDDKMLERYGKKERDPASERALKPRECPACGAENAPTNMFCKPCSHPLSPMAEEKIQKRRVEDLMDAMRDTESFKEMLASEVRRHLEGTS